MVFSGRAQRYLGFFAATGLTVLGLVAGHALAQTPETQRRSEGGSAVEVGAVQHAKDGSGVTAKTTGTTTVQSDDSARAKVREDASDRREQQSLEANQAMARVAVDTRILAYWQVGLGAVGTILLILTLYYSRRATKAAVAAANVARDALTLVERPHVFLKPIAADPLNYNQFAERGAAQPSFEFQFENSGRSPAITKGCLAEIIVADELPASPVFTEKWREGESVIPAGKFGEAQRCVFIPGISLVEGNAILAGTLKVFLIGYVRYADTLGYLHTTGWGIEWIPKESMFATAGGSAYNYRKTERDPDPS
jgi:hypothetical protein